MSVDHTTIRREIDEGIGATGRIRIVAELAKTSDRMFTAYAIAVATGLNPSDVKKDLFHLLAVNWVKEYKNVKYSIYQLNMRNPVVTKLGEFLRTVGYLYSHEYPLRPPSSEANHVLEK